VWLAGHGKLCFQLACLQVGGQLLQGVQGGQRSESPKAVRLPTAASSGGHRCRRGCSSARRQLLQPAVCGRRGAFVRSAEAGPGWRPRVAPAPAPARSMLQRAHHSQPVLLLRQKLLLLQPAAQRRRRQQRRSAGHQARARGRAAEAGHLVAAGTHAAAATAAARHANIQPRHREGMVIGLAVGSR
jgi:hypothetical protein